MKELKADEYDADLVAFFRAVESGEGIESRRRPRL